MKQITFKEQVTIEQLEQRAKDGECVALVSNHGDCVWNYGTDSWLVTSVGNVVTFKQYDNLPECIASIDNKSWTDFKTQLPVATGDVIHFSKLKPGDVIEWHKADGSRERDIVDDTTDDGIETLEGRAFYDDSIYGTFFKLDLPPLHQPKKGVLRYKTLEELEWSFDKQRGVYKSLGCGVVYQIDDWEDIGISYWIGESDTVGNEAVSVEQAKRACQDHYKAEVLALIQPLCKRPNSLDNV